MKDTFYYKLFLDSKAKIFRCNKKLCKKIKTVNIASHGLRVHYVDPHRKSLSIFLETLRMETKFESPSTNWSNVDGSARYLSNRLTLPFNKSLRLNCRYVSLILLEYSS